MRAEIYGLCIAHTQTHTQTRNIHMYVCGLNKAFLQKAPSKALKVLPRKALKAPTLGELLQALKKRLGGLEFFFLVWISIYQHLSVKLVEGSRLIILLRCVCVCVSVALSSRTSTPSLSHTPRTPERLRV